MIRRLLTPIFWYLHKMLDQTSNIFLIDLNATSLKIQNNTFKYIFEIQISLDASYLCELKARDEKFTHITESNLLWCEILRHFCIFRAILQAQLTFRFYLDM